MTRVELLRFKKILEDEREAALRAAFRQRQRISTEQSAEAFEQLGYDVDRELALADLIRHSGLIREIRAALDRIETGAFGVCLSCQKPIRPKRLMAVPWAPLCIRCQETAEEQDGADHDFPGEARQTAA